ncbi:hypothetical protein OG756_37690 [Streptomyces sp. NBC_01310]|uniref:hypothetical protein n=1 Tax=Streptomyces sp. NBC_01310 TaxID=2903820 RepID=UPI0035B6566A|nr:hypothetical protein OG756_37690 [Streptomyces sp. NBC_01310]
MSVDVDAVTFELYGLRPGEFTAARDAYVARARREKDTAAAAAIGRLRKPTLGVWAANLLARSRPDQAEALLRLGLELRRAHRELDGAQLRALSHEQHQVIGALVREAGQLAAGAGERLRDAALREIEEILRRVLADEEAARQWASGCLAKAPTGVVGFDGLEPEPGAAPPPAAPAPRRTAPAPARTAPGSAPAPARTAGGREDAAARRAAEKHRAERAAAREQAADAAAALHGADRRLAEAAAERDRAEGDADALRDELAALQQRVDAARQTAREAKRLHRQAEQAQTKARRTAQSAARRLEELDGSEA